MRREFARIPIPDWAGRLLRATSRRALAMGKVKGRCLVGICWGGRSSCSIKGPTRPVSSIFPDLIAPQGPIMRPSRNFEKARFQGPPPSSCISRAVRQSPSAIHTKHCPDHAVYCQNSPRQVGFCPPLGSTLSPDRVTHWLTPPKWKGTTPSQHRPARQVQGMSPCTFDSERRMG
jgi:hypothetical protein